MSVFKPIKCTSSQLSNIAVVDGQLIFITDTNEVYLDSDGFRSKYGGTEKIGDVACFSWDGKSSTANSNNLELWTNIVNSLPAIVMCNTPSYKALFIISDVSSGVPIYSLHVDNAGFGTTSYGSSAPVQKCIKTKVTYSNSNSKKKVTNVETPSVETSDIYYLATKAYGSLGYGSFTPTNDMHPTTKKYVDDKIKTAIGDALGGSY